MIRIIFKKYPISPPPNPWKKIRSKPLAPAVAQWNPRSESSNLIEAKLSHQVLRFQVKPGVLGLRFIAYVCYVFNDCYIFTSWYLHLYMYLSICQCVFLNNVLRVCMMFWVFVADFRGVEMNRTHKEEQLHKLKNTLRKNNVYTLHSVFQCFLVMSLSLSRAPSCVSMYFLLDI